MAVQRCRICNTMIQRAGYPNHISMHKGEYLRAIGEDGSLHNRWKVEWKDVLAFYNVPEAPKEASRQKISEQVAAEYKLRNVKRLTEWVR